MKILMTVNAAWNIWNFRRPIVKALIGKGHEITVLAPPDASVDKLQDLGCRYLPLTMSVKGLNPVADLKLQRQFERIFRDERPSIVLSYTIKNNVFGARAARKTGTPFLPNVTGLGTAFLSGRVLQSVTEHLYRTSFADLPIIFFQNEDDRDLFADRALIRPEQARLLPGSGIDLAYFSPLPFPSSSAPTFLMIARLLRDKGVLEFVEAARLVRQEYPSARFQLLGALGAQNRSAIQSAMVEQWVNEGVIEYLGTTDDVRPAIEAATCVVLPSYREGAPRTLIEAASMARPIITTDVPGCRSVVDQGVSGLLCKARSAESLAEELKRFLRFTTDQQQKMGQAGRQKMEREFDESLVVKAYETALSEVQRSTSSLSERSW